MFVGLTLGRTGTLVTEFGVLWSTASPLRCTRILPGTQEIISLCPVDPHLGRCLELLWVLFPSSCTYSLEARC